jgi:hypothetical protein
MEQVTSSTSSTTIEDAVVPSLPVIPMVEDELFTHSSAGVTAISSTTDPAVAATTASSNQSLEEGEIHDLSMVVNSSFGCQDSAVTEKLLAEAEKLLQAQNDFMENTEALLNQSQPSTSSSTINDCTPKLVPPLRLHRGRMTPKCGLQAQTQQKSSDSPTHGFFQSERIR